MYGFLTTLTILAGIGRLVQANPVPAPFNETSIIDERESPCIPCRRVESYSITNQFDWATGFQMIGGYSCESTTGSPCNLQSGRELTVGVSISAGFDLGLVFKEIFSAGVSTSVSIEQSTTVTTAVQVGCPDGVWCGFMHQDGTRIVQGYKKVEYVCPSVSKACGTSYVQSNDYYQVNFPRKSDNGQINTKVYACACPDHGDQSHKPSDMFYCPQNCL